MKNHKHAHDISAVFEPAHPVRFAAARKSTWVSIFINLVLTIIQVLAGFFGKSQSLMADGLHSLADLLSDVLVLFANRHGNKHADAEHPYGHARIETAASLILGASLAALGIFNQRPGPIDRPDAVDKSSGWNTGIILVNFPISVGILDPAAVGRFAGCAGGHLAGYADDLAQ